MDNFLLDVNTVIEIRPWQAVSIEITGKGENSYFGTNFAVMIKCWKCRETITLKPLNNINYLVQASHVCLKSE